MFSQLRASIKTVATTIKNIRGAFRNRDPEVIVRSLVASGHHCVIIKPDFHGFPKIDLIKYRELAAASEVPLVRVNYSAVKDLFDPQVASLDDLGVFGASVVQGIGRAAKVSPFEIVQSVVANGWHILTVEEAFEILGARDFSRVRDICLTSGNRWLTPIENIADLHGIATSLFAICEQVIACRTATMIFYTPGLPGVFKLWRLSLDKFMPPLPRLD